MNTEIAKYNGSVAQATPSLISELGSYAEVFMRSGLFSDTKSRDQAVVKMLAGRELGLGPFESMRDVNIIQGKTTLAGAQIAARIKKTGVYDYEIKQFDEKAAVLRFTKNGKPLSPEISFSIEDAAAMGLASRDNYKKQARTMLFWRAVTMGARMHCPEVFGGAIYTPDEIAKDAPVDAIPTEALPVTTPSVVLANRDEIDEVTDLIDTTGTDMATVDKWFQKAKVETWQEMPAETVHKIITHLRAKLEAE